MMKGKHILLLLLLVVCATCGFARDNPYAKPDKAAVLGMGIDASVIDASWTGQLQARMNFNLRLSPSFGLRLPFTFCMAVKDTSLMLFDFGIMLDYHPWGDGPFVSVSLIELGMIAGRNRPSQSIQFLNEVILGWTWHIYQGLYVEPAVIVRDPSGCFEAEYDSIRSMFPSMGPFRFSFVIGWDFLKIPY